jgi:glycine cleavage system transcriptional repressor
VGELAVTVIGHDRPGIIADVAEVLSGLGMNLTDSTMTRLRGHFAMTLICTGDPDPADVEAGLAPLAADGTLDVSVRPVRPEPEPAAGGLPYVLTVHGADRLGIVATVARAVAEFGGNVTDLTTRLAGDLYLLVAEVDIPPADAGRLTERLAGVAGVLNVDVALRPGEADVL